MRIGYVMVLWFLTRALFAQNCEEITIGSVHYFEGQNEDKTEISSFFIPCNKTPVLSFSLPQLADPHDPDPATPSGVVLFLLKNDPGTTMLSVSEFSELLYRDINDELVYYDGITEHIDVDDLRDIGNTTNQYVLMPVLVSNLQGDSPASWFESNCVRMDPDQKLTLIEHVKEYQFYKFNEITFTLWPDEIPITEYFDFEFLNYETGERISHYPLDNRTFRLEFDQAEGIFSFVISWKNHNCQEVELGANWNFPTVNLVVDTAAGYQNIDICVPVRGFQLESITGFQLELTWDSDSMEYTGIKNIHPLLEEGFQISEVYEDTGQMRIYLEWDHAAEPISLPDSSVLFSWCGKAKSEAGEFVQLSWSKNVDDRPVKFEVLGLETSHKTSSGGIKVLEDRELFFELNQLCTTLEGNRRIQVEITSEPAAPYTLSILSGDFSDTLSHLEPYTIHGLEPGAYGITIRDSFGFEKTEVFEVLDQIDPGFVMQVDEETVITPTCLNPFGGEIGVAFAPENQNYDLHFLNDDAVFEAQKAQGLEGGTYIIKAVNELGCIDTLHFTLPPPAEIRVGWDEEDLVLCPGTEAVYLEFEAQGNIYESGLEFQLGDGQAHQVGEKIPLTKGGTYAVQFWNEDGCILDTIVLVREAPKELVIWDTSCIDVVYGDALMFVSPEPTGLNEVTWFFDRNVIGNQPELNFSPSQSGTLSYAATVYEQCIYQDTLRVEVIHPGSSTIEYNFPNAFTPNGDGVNDEYIIFPTREIRQIRKMQIFDRYGNPVFVERISENSDSRFAWDGFSSGAEVPPGIYPVVLEVELRNGQQEIVSFEVTVIR